MTRRVLVAGCGYVGAEVAARLAERGEEVFGLRRSDGPGPAGVVMIAADLTRAETLSALPTGITHVVYAAAATGFGEAAYRAIYVEGVRNLLTTLAGRGDPLERVVYVSSTSVYAQSSGEAVDEGSETAPTSFAGTTLLEGEALVGAGPWSGVVLRAGGIYGPGRTRLVEEVRQRAVELTDGAPIFTNRIHQADCAGAAIHLLDLAAPEAIYNGVDEEHAERNAVLSWLAERLGVAPLGTGGVESLPARTLRSNKRVSGDRLRRSGYAFRYPTFREGYAELLGI